MVCVRLPDVPVTLRLSAPTGALLLMVSVSRLVLVVLGELNTAATPAGGSAVRLMLPLNPFMRVTVTVVVATPPRTIFNESLETKKVKSFVPVPASALIVLMPVGEPQPVQRS